MTLKGDAKFKGKLIRGLKNDIRYGKKRLRKKKEKKKNAKLKNANEWPKNL